jgi:hypothetical protein
MQQCLQRFLFDDLTGRLLPSRLAALPASPDLDESRMFRLFYYLLPSVQAEAEPSHFYSRQFLLSATRVARMIPESSMFFEL